MGMIPQILQLDISEPKASVKTAVPGKHVFVGDIPALQLRVILVNG